ncbi:alanine and arginine-rich domain-containing protein [Pristis pectinata]|uniref:alanine and arginine-rich domain-containing protein n=1 Tax=Pristis pectinata TaxID=685728 RepID=UPI00223DC0CD|nr:alanine and arginine-rich domain-containing protein [Pristis pectinata]
MSSDSQYEDTESSMVLEDIKRRLLSAFRGAPAPCRPAQPRSLSGNARADEELRRAQIDGAISWVRTELLEMRYQDRQLARTLLELNSEIQKLRKEQGLFKCLGSEPTPARTSGAQHSRASSAARRTGRKHT